ncbi:hypothetical protein K469DRAFT_693587 [Zopfia rhizophila CBS 207.26]|uniref:Extracellular membrane protein CFEM domain-containing protein n=1 Tax=Zopfia rhizophila CBS 207.26 TaxID=1314779 RepID=A0A6A6DR81_9PEZI|nr:hypothetical protein K469DRAFT_693587 [Zopfia rhizophila CBS 207.26]
MRFLPTLLALIFFAPAALTCKCKGTGTAGYQYVTQYCCRETNGTFQYGDDCMISSGFSTFATCWEEGEKSEEERGVRWKEGKRKSDVGGGEGRGGRMGIFEDEEIQRYKNGKNAIGLLFFAAL